MVGKVSYIVHVHVVALCKKYSQPSLGFLWFFTNGDCQKIGIQVYDNFFTTQGHLDQSFWYI